MCRPQSQGGRRCAVHSSSAFIFTHSVMASLKDNDIYYDKSHVVDCFKILRIEHENARKTSGDTWNMDFSSWTHALSTKKSDLEDNKEVHGSTKTALNKHLKEAAEEKFDSASMTAFHELESHFLEREETLKGYLTAYSQSTSMTRQEVIDMYNYHKKEATKNVKLYNSTFTEENIYFCQDEFLPLDPSSVYAITKMKEHLPLVDQTDAPGESLFKESDFIDFSSSKTKFGMRVKHTLASGAYHEKKRIMRLVSEEGKIFEIRNVHKDEWKRFLNGNKVKQEYIIQGHFLQEGVDLQKRCHNCGQFEATDHHCPAFTSDELYASSMFPNFGKDKKKDQFENEREDKIIEYVRNIINNIDSYEPEEYAPPILKINDALPYDNEAFIKDISQVAEVSYMTENATDGLCTPENGMGFGVELEFDIKKGKNRSKVIKKIAKELHEKGIISSPEQKEYHAAQESGWSEWSLEEDQTVAGEIVSPILYDTPETWKQLETICEIVKKHGGVATTRTGSHVHVSSQHLGDSSVKHADLVAKTNKYEDLIYRMGTNPENEVHRPSYWCGPNEGMRSSYGNYFISRGYSGKPKPSSKWYDYTVNASILENHSGHNVGLNIGESSNGKASHVEFRQWDATLDPAIIQTQIKMSAAIVARSSLVESHEKTRGDIYKASRVGKNAKADKSKGEDITQGSDLLREFSSQHFSRPEDHLQMAQLFSKTRWQDDIEEGDDGGYY